ncbi:hemolysin III family protein [Roseomonas sp. CCTCC AB2023176]|uniref:PAQR family membrane homeostasis protein TrhA n=1 Tax=Roseomonas sp. CCTCC AB2023176 TaxID=3342640 RepID=UPI0035E319FB
MLYASIAERRADAAVHALGVTGAVLGCLALAVFARGEPAVVVVTALYLTGLVATFACSAAFNLSQEGPRRARLRRLDHAAIFLMIAGTYSPVAVLAIGGTGGAVLLALVWVGAMAGAAVKILAFGRFVRWSVAAYLVLGWAGVAVFPELARTMPWETLALLAAGGFLYSLGVLAYRATWMRFHDAVWHAFVLAAAACHYAMVFRLVTA